MTVTQGVFLAAGLVTVGLCLTTSVMSVQRGWHYREYGDRAIRFFAGGLIAMMLATIVLITSYERLTGNGAISAVDGLRAALDLALSGLFLAILRGTARRDRRESRLEEASQTDPLTQLPNRAGFDVDAASLLEECEERALPVSVAMLDIDRFKAVNDGWGHQAGDEVLRALARVGRETTRGEDVLARYGGEEFILLMRGVSPEEALPLVERLRNAIATGVAHPSGEGRITVSAGIAAVDNADLRALKPAIKRADEALYMAKDAGRDRSFIAPFDEASRRLGETAAEPASVL